MNYEDVPKELNELSGIIIGLAIKVHRALGPGLLESFYKECLFYEIVKAGYFAEKEKALPLIYEAVQLELSGNRLALLINFNVTLLKSGIKRLVL